MLRPYGPDDLELQVRLLGDAATMEHLGGPETREQIERRHERYLRMTDPADGLQLVIETSDGTAAGTIGYWTKAWRDATVGETGWFVLPGFRGRGLATAGLQALLARLAALPETRPLHAFPAVDNPPSNAVCRKAGFELLEALDFEYPKGSFLRCNDWRYRFSA
jgi:RimJ/RimL family protein N-acetyltransferase